MYKKCSLFVLLAAIGVTLLLFHADDSPLAAGKAKKPSYRIIKENHTEKSALNNVSIYYPQIVGLEDSDKQNSINELLKSEALRPLMRPADDDRLLTLPLNYQIAWMGENLLSIQFEGLSNIKGAPYPCHLFFTVNIDMSKGCKLRLNDMITIDEDFVAKIRNKEVKSLHTSRLNGESVLGGHGTEISTINDTIARFADADSISAKDYYRSDIETYFTPTALGISVQIPHAWGDHAEFEIKYKDIANHLRPQNDVWQDFFPR